jgi:hypothetical protein
LTIGTLYVLALTVKPIRAAFLNFPLLATMLPNDAALADDHDHDEDIGSHQILEIAFSPTAAKNIGLDDSAIITVEAVDYYKSFSFPAVVVERPGFSTITVPSPMSGVITKIYHETGVAVEPGDPLFDIMLNQQEFLKAQSEFLALLQKRAINNAELEWLAGMDALIVPKQRRELEYEKILIDSAIQQNILLLQGLTESDITESLEKTGTIIRSMTVYAPPFENDEHSASTAHAEEEEHIFTIDELFVSVGSTITVGDPLCKLTDYCKLAIKGKVFAVNEKMLKEALALKSRVTATFGGNGNRETVEGLFLRSIDNRIDPVSGTLFCYVDLRNHFQNYEVNGESHSRRYIQWHFKPGQRCELNVEVEPLPNSIVLPVGAVAKDFQEMYVFEWVGNDEDRRIWRKTPVHVIHQTRDHVVIANDGSLFEGAMVAAKGANFILAALGAMNQKGDGGAISGCGLDHEH